MNIGDTSPFAIGKTKDGRISLVFTYAPELIAAVKTIPGYRRHSIERFRSFPDVPSTLEKINTLLPDADIRSDSLSALQKEMSSLSALQKEMSIRKYSPKTIKSYLFYNKMLIEYAKKDVSGIGQVHIKQFLAFLAEEKKISVLKERLFA